jgi:hypothetical protein
MDHRLALQVKDILDAKYPLVAMQPKGLGFHLGGAGLGKFVQPDFGEFTGSVSGHYFEKLEHEALSIELADKGASSLLTQEHVLRHQLVHGAPNRPYRNLKALCQIFFVWQSRTGCRKTGLDVVDQLPFDLAIKHAEKSFQSTSPESL